MMAETSQTVTGHPRLEVARAECAVRRQSLPPGATSLKLRVDPARKAPVEEPRGQ